MEACKLYVKMYVRSAPKRDIKKVAICGIWNPMVNNSPANAKDSTIEFELVVPEYYPFLGAHLMTYCGLLGMQQNLLADKYSKTMVYNSSMCDITHWENIKTDDVVQTINEQIESLKKSIKALQAA